ncbi:MAG: hypothetical protein OWU84_07565 [Firmicutes bacterium]|nr:hypothetical protein [Bacillota bacterium]
MSMRWGALALAPMLLAWWMPGQPGHHPTRPHHGQQGQQGNRDHGPKLKGGVTVTLSSAMVSPGQAVTIDASVNQGVSVSEYVFWVRGPRGGWRRVATSTTGQATVTETTAGLYWVRVEAMVSAAARDHGRGPKDRVLFSEPVLFDVGAGIRLSVMPTSVAEGGRVLLRAWAPGVPGPLYQFSYEPPGGSWVTVGAFSHIPHVRLKMTTPGSYEGRVAVKLRDGEVLESDTVSWSVYGAPSALTLLPSPSVWVADGQETGVIQVEAVDAQGDLVSTFNGSGTITDAQPAGAISAWGTTSGSLVPVASQPTETLTFHNGVADVYIQAGTTVTSDTLTASAALSSTSVISGTLTLSAVAQVATAVAVSPVSTALLANESGNPGTFDVWVDDQVGEPMLTGTYTLTASLTGPAQFQSLTSGPVSVTYVGGEGLLPVTVYSMAGESGTVTLTVSGPSLTTGSATLTALFGGQPAQASVTAASTTLSDGETTTLDIGQVTATGGPVDPASVDNSGYVVTITGPSDTAATGFTLNGEPYTGPTVIAVATGTNGFYATSQPVTLGVTTAAPGTYTVEVAFEDGLFHPSAPLTITVTSPSSNNG